MDSKFERYVGRIFDRRYKITKIIGVGGMAVVFEAVDLVMHRTVAVKMLKDEISNDTQAVKRFINESKAVSMLSHPNIVSICDVSVRDNIKYIVMERIEGITLKKYMTKKGVLSLRETINITQQILRALEHAHSKGIIHRDIKPQNIMMLRNGQIKVTDFGIARLPNAENVTMTDKAVGTVYYISPEQASAKAIDSRSDLYSLGIMIYEMMTGKLPFVSENPLTVAMMQVNRQPKRPREINPDIPVGMEQIILTAMEKNPDRRFQSATAMLRSLDQIKTNPHYVFTARTPQNGKGSAKNHTSSRSAVRTGTAPKPKKKEKQSRSMFPIITGVTAAFFLVAVFSGIVALNLIINGSAKDQTVVVGDYIGQNYEEIKAELEQERCYTLTVNKVYNDKPYGEILDQKPAKDSKRKIQPGKTTVELELTISRGPRSFMLEDYTLTHVSSTKIILQQQLGLKCTVVNEDSETVPEGYIIRTNPAAGVTVTAGNTITLYVSKGQSLQFTHIPDCVNKTAASAAILLKDAGLKAGNITYEYSESVKEGVVISQSGIALSEVVKGTKVDLVISLGPKPSAQTE